MGEPPRGVGLPPLCQGMEGHRPPQPRRTPSSTSPHPELRLETTDRGRAAGGETEARSWGGSQWPMGCGVPRLHPASLLLWDKGRCHGTWGPDAGAGSHPVASRSWSQCVVGVPVAPRHAGERNGLGSPAAAVGAGGGGWGTRRDSPRWGEGGPQPPYPCGRSGALPRVGPRGRWGAPGEAPAAVMPPHPPPRCTPVPPGRLCGHPLVPSPGGTSGTQGRPQGHPAHVPAASASGASSFPGPDAKGKLIIAAEKLKIAPGRRAGYF